MLYKQWVHEHTPASPPPFFWWGGGGVLGEITMRTLRASYTRLRMFFWSYWGSLGDWHLK